MTNSTRSSRVSSARSLFPGRVALAALALLVAALPAQAQPFAIRWSTVDSGGTSSADGPGFSYTLAGTLAQPDAGPVPSAAGGPYTVVGGFWTGAPNCPVDWDGNGVVNAVDVSEFFNDWFSDQAGGTTVADWDQNGTTNGVDVSNFLNAFFVGCPSI